MRLPASSFCQKHGNYTISSQHTFARYYDPTTTSFTSMDPAYLSTNQAYSYGAGDPVNRWDPTRMTCQDIEQAVQDANNAGALLNTQSLEALSANCGDTNTVQQLVNGNY